MSGNGMFRRRSTAQQNNFLSLWPLLRVVHREMSVRHKTPCLRGIRMRSSASFNIRRMNVFCFFFFCFFFFFFPRESLVEAFEIIVVIEIDNERFVC